MKQTSLEILRNIVKTVLLLSTILSTNLQASSSTTDSTPSILTLTSPKTHYNMKKDPLSPKGKTIYEPVYVPLKVMATYSDGHSEEVTDRVTLRNSKGRRFRFNGGGLILRVSEYIVSASLAGVTSNSIKIKVEKEDLTSKYLDVEMKNYYQNILMPYRKTVSIHMRLTKKPKAEVALTLKLKEKDNMVFPYSSTRLTQTLHFTPENWDTYQNVDISSRTKGADDMRVVTEPFESQDADYDGKNPEDIVLKKTKVQLIEPPIEQRRGAIRGVTIRFQVSSKESVLKYELIDPPRGMKIIGDSNFGYDFSMHGTDIEWHVPMDATESETYHITVKGTDFEGHSQTITFPIKVPKTKPIQTTLKNNELIVTDKSSALFGMKMKGHSGEDVSALRLRSVEYGDVWKKKVENKKPEDVIEHVVFILDDMPEALDVKMPEWMDTYNERINLGMHSYKYTGTALFPSEQWERATRKSYLYENTNGYTYLHKNNSSEIFFIILEQTQNRGK